MRAQILWTLSLCLLGCFGVRNLAQEKSDVASIRTLELKWVDSYKQRQIAAVAALLAEDYVITLEDGSTYGKVGFISYNAGPMCGAKRYQASQIFYVIVFRHRQRMTI